MRRGVEFIEKHQKEGNKVYIHCKAGHGRSAAVALAWLAKQNPSKTLKQLNDEMVEKRRVRKVLWKQPGLNQLKTEYDEEGEELQTFKEEAN